MNCIFNVVEFTIQSSERPYKYTATISRYEYNAFMRNFYTGDTIELKPDFEAMTLTLMSNDTSRLYHRLMCELIPTSTPRDDGPTADKQQL